MLDLEVKTQAVRTNAKQGVWNAKAVRYVALSGTLADLEDCSGSLFGSLANHNHDESKVRNSAATGDGWYPSELKELLANMFVAAFSRMA